MTSDAYPSLPRTVGLLLTTLVVAGGLAIVAYETLPDWPEIVRMALPTEIALALAVAWAVRRSGVGWRRALAWRPLDVRHLVPLGLVLVGSLTVFTELYLVIQRLAPVPDAFERALSDLLEMSGTADAVATIVVAIVLAPILEEALFRGAILQGLTRRYGPRKATVWTALFFAFFHLYNPWQILPTFFLGLVLAWLVLTTRSLVAAILVHSAFNAASLGLFALELDAAPREPGSAAWMAVGIVAFLLIGSVGLLWGMAWLEAQTGGGGFANPAPDPDLPGAGPGPPDPADPGAGSSEADRSPARRG